MNDMRILKVDSEYYISLDDLRDYMLEMYNNEETPFHMLHYVKGLVLWFEELIKWNRNKNADWDVEIPG